MSNRLILTLCIVALYSVASRADQPAFSEEEIQKAGHNQAQLQFRRQKAVSMPMKVTKTEWTSQDEERFGQFVLKIANAVAEKKCNTVNNCMKNSEVNQYASTDPESLLFYADCGIFPYLLRSYFALKNGLPFSIVSVTSMNSSPFASEPNEALSEMLKTAEAEASPFGNKIESRDGKTNADRPGEERNFQQYLGTLIDLISTRVYRVGPLTPDYNLSDFYPVTLDRKGIRAGTIVYTTGHVYLVYKVDPSGIIHLLDAHPDNSVSAMKTLSAATLERSRPDHGLGFFKFRQTRLSGARLIDGSLYGGVVKRTSDSDLFDQGLYSLEQYFGPGSKIAPASRVAPSAWRRGFAGVDFFTYLNTKLRSSELETNALDEMAELFKSFCNEIQQRVADVDQALADGVKLNYRAHPTELPANIFSTKELSWETYSSPGRDGRMRGFIPYFVNAAVEKFKQTRQSNTKVHFKGSAAQYQKALRDQLATVSNSCVINYKKSDGVLVPLTMTDVIARLTRISFDPFHCAERRWGAKGTELMSCRDEDLNSDWYKGEQVMRNTIGKTTSTEMLVVRSNRPITIDMLRDASMSDQPDSGEVNLGSKTVPNLNLDSIYASDEFLSRLH